MGADKQIVSNSAAAALVEKPKANVSPGGDAAGQAAAPKKKICCACPDTKKLRDECIAAHGEEACGKWIEVHLRCLRQEGFNV